MANTNNRGNALQEQPRIVYQHALSDGDFDPLNSTSLPAWVKSAFSGGFVVLAVTDASTLSVMPIGNMKDTGSYKQGVNTLPTDTDKIIELPSVSNTDWYNLVCIAVYQTGSDDVSILVGCE